MSWINEKSFQLVNTPEGRDFARNNNLQWNGYREMANFNNKHVRIAIYEERGCLHADYYDLENLRWCRQLENHAIDEGLIPLASAKAVYQSATEAAKAGCLGIESMVRFLFYLKMIDLYMQDFLIGDLKRYEHILQPLESHHKEEVEKFKKTFIRQ
jgi:hypothetical protein